MITDPSTDVHFSAGMQMLQAREQNAPLPPPKNAKMEVSNASCGVMHSFILKTERIKYIYIKERKSV